MTRLILGLAAALVTSACSAADNKENAKVTGPLELKIAGIDGKELDLSQYKGKVVLFVNVASRCGFTDQYTDLQGLYEKYGKDGLVVIGVPANEFGAQEPGSNDDIKKFCTTKYKVTFPMTAKVVVKGEGITPLYQYLTSKDTNPKFGGDVGWNFEKFLVNRKGEVVGRFESGVEPMSDKLVKAITKELEAK